MPSYAVSFTGPAARQHGPLPDVQAADLVALGHAIAAHTSPADSTPGARFEIQIGDERGVLRHLTDCVDIHFEIYRKDS